MKKNPFLTLILLATSFSLYADSPFTHGEPGDPTADDELLVANGWRSRNDKQTDTPEQSPLKNKRQKDDSTKLEQQRKKQQATKEEERKRKQLAADIELANDERNFLVKKHDEYNKQANEHKKYLYLWRVASYSSLFVTGISIYYDYNKESLITLGKNAALVAATVASIYKAGENLKAREYYQKKSSNAEKDLKEKEEEIEELRRKYQG